jgi:hypothetical protein
MSHKYSIEVLIHVRCGKCAKWFSVSVESADDTVPTHCPKCGVVSGIEFETDLPQAKKLLSVLNAFAKEAEAFIARNPERKF